MIPRRLADGRVRLISEIPKFYPNAHLCKPPIGHIACHTSVCHNHDFMQIVPLAVLSVNRVDEGLAGTFQGRFREAIFADSVWSVHHDYHGVYYRTVMSSGVHHQQSGQS